MSNHRALSGTPTRDEWSPFHLQYLTRYLPGEAKAPGAPVAALGHEDDALTFLDKQRRTLEGLAAEILSDTERILAWRSLAAARGDRTNIQPFDEEAYAAAAGHDAIPVSDLLTGIVAVRKSSLALFSTYDHDAWRRRGLSNGHPVSARAWAFVIGAHAALHLDTLRTKYLA